MTKLVINIGKYLFRSIEWIMILFIVFAFAIRTSSFQTYLAQQVTSYLSQKLQHRISIGRIDVPFYNHVVLEDVYADDVARDTLFSMKKIDVVLGFYRAFPKKLTIKEVSLENGAAFLKRDSLTHDFNFQYLVDFFSTNEKKKPTKPFPIVVKKLQLKNIHFKLLDERYDRQPFGMDYDHLDVNHITVLASNIHMLGENITADVKHISAREISGFVLSKLSSKFAINQKGMFFDNLKILTPNSSIKLTHLYFKMNGLNKFRSFVDDVAFDSDLAMSTVNMQDITYFAPQLRGMDETIKIQVKVMDRVKDMKINDLKLYVRSQTVIEGNLTLPDFRNLTKENIQEEISYAMVNLNELNSVKLPIGGVFAKTLNLDSTVLRLGVAEIRNLRTRGTLDNFLVNLGKVKTTIGSAEINHDILFYPKGDGIVGFKEVREPDDSSNITISNFDLGTFLAMNDFGIVDGKVNVDGEYSLKDGISFYNGNGHLNRFDYQTYPYSQIDFKDVSYSQEKEEADGKLNINDPNATLTFNGKINYGKSASLTANVLIDRLELATTHLISADSSLILSGFIDADLTGIDGFGLNGKVNLNNFCLTNRGREFHTKEAYLELSNHSHNNSIYLRSDILDADVSGIINYDKVIAEIERTLTPAMPVFFKKDLTTSNKKKRIVDKSEFTFNLNLKSINELLGIFIDRVHVEDGSKIFGNYSSEQDSLELTLKSPKIQFRTFQASNLNFHNKFTKNGANIRYQAEKFFANDSLTPFDSLLFVSRGTTDSLTSFIKWGRRNVDFSGVKWTTEINSLQDMVFHVEKSLFTLNTHKWRLQKAVTIAYKSNAFSIDSLELSHENQLITANGEYSKQKGKHLDIVTKDLDLADLSDIFNLEVKVGGTANGKFIFSNENNIFRLAGNTQVQKLVLNGSEIGDLNVVGGWNENKKAITIMGSLFYKEFKTFNINGNYYVKRDKDYLEFNVDFNKTKIDFLNAFMDPEVISNIKGNLDGTLTIRGDFDKPIIKGEVDLTKGNVKVGMFGVNYGFSGKVKAFDDLITFDNMPLTDEEGNQGVLTGSIIHDHFKNFNFDVFIGLDNLKRLDGTPATSFLGMDTHYKDGILYYGKAYVKGWVGISGYLDNLDVEVNLKTRKNTTVVLPMYGAEEVDNQLSYDFVSKDTIQKVEASKKLNLLGVNLSLNFDVTPDAKIKLVFNDVTGEEMSATGSGRISINYDNEDNLTMDGTYRIDDGYYNFVFNPIRKKFIVEKGSSISWRGGGPMDADLNINADYKVNTDLSKIAPELESQSTASTTQDVYAKLFVTGTIDAPQISFKISAPTASESARASLDRINTDNDELNKQFFMLLLTGHFQTSGVAGIGSNGTNAALEALSGQINNLLDAVSKDVRLNVDLRSDDLSGRNSQAVGFETNLLNNRLIIKGNFGVQNNHVASENGGISSSFIGDLSLEYLIDGAGNLRVNVFNESNSYSLLQDKDLGLFTQGVGLIYSESFTKFKETNFANFVADIFRKDKHYKFTKRRKQKLLPQYQHQPMTKPEEEKE